MLRLVILKAGSIGVVAGGVIHLVADTANSPVSTNQTAFYTMVGVLGAALITGVAMVIVARTKTPLATPPRTPEQNALMELVKEQAEVIVDQAREIEELKTHGRRKN